MTITLYTVSEDIKTVHKDPQIIGIAKPISPTGIVSRDLPIITIDYVASFVNANYMHIDIYDRYYYITTSVDIAGKILITATACDVLKSFEQTLASVPVTVVRSESAGVNAVVDSQLPINQNKVSETSIELDNNLFNTASVTPYVLTVIGGHGA